MISMIVAVDKNNGIGKDNQLLVHIKQDLQYFKKVTDGHTVIMGYNTWVSLPKKPLPGRRNIVLTSKDITIDGVEVIHNMDDILRIKEDIFIIGGASIYKQMLDYSDRLYVTHMFEDFEADVFFPELNDDWKIVEVKADKENIRHKHPHVFTIYEKK